VHHVKLKASEERNRIFNELGSLKENLSKRKISAKSISPKGNFSRIFFLKLTF